MKNRRTRLAKALLKAGKYKNLMIWALSILQSQRLKAILGMAFGQGQAQTINPLPLANTMQIGDHPSLNNLNNQPTAPGRAKWKSRVTNI